MNKTLGLLFLVVAIAFAGQKAENPKGVQWMPLSTALQKASKDSSLVFVEVMAEWCGPCHAMERTTFQDKAVIQYLNTRFHSVRLDADSEELIPCMGQNVSVSTCVGDVWGLAGVPSLLFLAPNGTPVASLTAALDPPRMQQLLNEVLESRRELLRDAGK